MNTQKNLYEKDFTAWIAQQIECLKNKNIENIDTENLIEELESVGNSEKRSMKSYFIILIMHMLKWKYQPQKRTASWVNSIIFSRDAIEDILKSSPSLKNHLQVAYEQAWNLGREGALRETGLEKHAIPQACPWSVYQILNEKLDERSINKNYRS